MIVADKLLTAHRQNVGGSSEYWINEMDAFGVNAIMAASDGIFFSGGTSSYGSGSADAIFGKLSHSGELLWARTLGDGITQTSNSLCVDSSDNLYISGYMYSSTPYIHDAILAKYSSSGVLQWQKKYGGTGGEYYYGIKTTSSGNIIAVGQTFSTDASGDVLVTHINSLDGTVIWTKTLNSGATDVSYSVDLDSSDNIYICGWTNYQNASYRQDNLFASLDINGTIRWGRYSRLNQTLSNDILMDVAVDKSNSYQYYVGYADDNASSPTSVRARILRYNSTNSQYFGKYFTGLGFTYLNGVAVDSDGSAIIVGYTRTTGSTTSKAIGIIFRIDSLGNIDTSFSKQLEYNSSRNTAPQAVTIDANGNVIVACHSLITTGMRSTIIKIPSNGTGNGTYGNYTYSDYTISLINGPGFGTAYSYPVSNFSAMTSSYTSFTDMPAPVTQTLNTITP